jgi:hypothetical protein
MLIIPVHIYFNLSALHVCDGGKYLLKINKCIGVRLQFYSSSHLSGSWTHGAQHTREEHRVRINQTLGRHQPDRASDSDKSAAKRAFYALPDLVYRLKHINSNSNDRYHL